MLCRDIIKKIEEQYPVSYALEWDNVGLLVGRYTKEVKSIYIALDATDEVIDEAVSMKADMLVTHHPMLFSPVKKVTEDDFISRRIMKLIRNDISYYAMHTNYDVLGMSQLAAFKLGLENTDVLEVTSNTAVIEGIGRIADIEEPVISLEYCKKVKEAFDLENVQLFGDPHKMIRRVAISPGSGKSMIRPALEKGADLLVTGDIGHHEGIDAVAQGMNIIDAGHFGIEHIFIEDMQSCFRNVFPGVNVTASPLKHPFVVF